MDVYKRRVDKVTARLNTITLQQQAIEACVDKAGLTTQEDNYVRLRYFGNMKHWRVAQRLNFSESHTSRLRLAAICKIEKMIGNESKNVLT